MITAITIRNEDEFNAVKAKLIEGDCIQVLSTTQNIPSFQLMTKKKGFVLVL